jgi:hypothetical protein
VTTPPELVEEGDPKGTALEAIAPPKRHLARRIVTWVLVVLFAILTPITIASAWAVKTVTNTDRYVSTLQPLSSNPVIINYVATKATTTLFDQLNVEGRIGAIVPFGGNLIAAPLTQQLETYTQAQIKRLLSTTWFQELWQKENEFTHSQAVNLLTGKDTGVSSTARKLVLNLTPALTKAIDELDAKGITVFDPIKRKLNTDKALTFALYTNEQVQTAQKYFGLAVDLRIFLLIFTPLVGIAAVVVAVERRRAALRTLLGGILGCLVLIVLLTWVRSRFVSAVPQDASQVAQEVWDTLTRYLHRLLYAVLGVFVLGSIGLWIAGPSTWAVATRRTIRGSSKKIATTADDAYHSETTSKAIEKATGVLESANSFVKRNLVPMRWVGVFVAALILISARTVSALFWTLVVLAIYQVLISVPWVRDQPALKRGSSKELSSVAEPGEDTPEDAIPKST